MATCECSEATLDWGQDNRQHCSGRQRCGVVRTTRVGGDLHHEVELEQRGVSYSADGGGDWDVYDAGRITSLPSDVAFHETWQYYPFACGDSVETGEVLGFAPYEWSRPPMFRSQFLEAFDMRTADEWSHHWRYLGRPSQNSVLVRREGEQCVYAVASCTCNEAG